VLNLGTAGAVSLSAASNDSQAMATPAVALVAPPSPAGALPALRVAEDGVRNQGAAAPAAPGPHGLLVSVPLGDASPALSPATPLASSRGLGSEQGRREVRSALTRRSSSRGLHDREGPAASRSKSRGCALLRTRTDYEKELASKDREIAQLRDQLQQRDFRIRLMHGRGQGSPEVAAPAPAACGEPSVSAGAKPAAVGSGSLVVATVRGGPQDAASGRVPAGRCSPVQRSTAAAADRVTYLERGRSRQPSPSSHSAPQPPAEAGVEPTEERREAAAWTVTVSVADGSDEAAFDRSAELNLGIGESGGAGNDARCTPPVPPVPAEYNGKSPAREPSPISFDDYLIRGGEFPHRVQILEATLEGDETLEDVPATPRGSSGPVTPGPPSSPADSAVLPAVNSGWTASGPPSPRNRWPSSLPCSQASPEIVQHLAQESEESKCTVAAGEPGTSAVVVVASPAAAPLPVAAAPATAAPGARSEGVTPPSGACRTSRTAGPVPSLPGRPAVLEQPSEGPSLAAPVHPSSGPSEEAHVSARPRVLSSSRSCLALLGGDALLTERRRSDSIAVTGTALCRTVSPAGQGSLAPCWTRAVTTRPASPVQSGRAVGPVPGVVPVAAPVLTARASHSAHTSPLPQSRSVCEVVGSGAVGTPIAPGALGTCVWGHTMSQAAAPAAPRRQQSEGLQPLPQGQGSPSPVTAACAAGSPPRACSSSSVPAVVAAATRRGCLATGGQVSPPANAVVTTAFP